MIQVLHLEPNSGGDSVYNECDVYGVDAGKKT